jgi:hypothetical protein
MKKLNFKSKFKVISMLTFAMLVFLVSCKVTETPVTFEKKILEFKFLKSLNPALKTDSLVGIINDTTHTISVPVGQFGVDVRNLIPTFGVSNLVSIARGKISQENKKTPNDFSTPIVYTLTAIDGSTQDYTVKVNIPEYSQCKLQSISFKNAFNSNLLIDVKGIINDITHVVNFVMPIGTDVTALKTSFIISTKAKASIAGVPQISDVTVNDFTTAKTMTVTSVDGTKSQDYTINVVVENIMSYTISTITDANNFAPVNGSVRNLTITGFGVNDAVMAVLATKNFDIKGTLLITGTKITKTVGFLDIISCKGDIELINNASLVDASGFANYTYIGGDLVIENNAKFKPMNPGGLSNIVRVDGKVRIVCPNITNNSLASLSYVGGDFDIEGGGKTVQLLNFNSMNLKYVGGNLILANNWFLSDYEALKSITTIGGNVTITGNNSAVPTAPTDNIVSFVKYLKDNNALTGTCVITITKWDGTAVVF